MTALTSWLLPMAGCCIGPTVDTVPWWKGVPCMVIAPSSLEATVWRDHLRARHVQEAMYVDDASYLEGQWLEPGPEDSMDTDVGETSAVEAPGEMGGASDLPPVPMSLDEFTPFPADQAAPRDPSERDDS